MDLHTVPHHHLCREAQGGHKALWVPGMRMPRVPRDRKEMVQEASYGSSEVSKDEGVGNHEGVQVGGDASIQAEE